MEEEIKLVIKKIPTGFSELDIISILDKAIKNNYYNLHYVKPCHVYDLKYNNLCFISIKNLDTRLKLEEFIDEYEIISKKGLKHKLELDLCIIQPKYEAPLINDINIHNNYKDLLHFQKFKEAFELDDILNFKENQDKCNLI